ncbi:MAG: Ig-like domain-containing protein [Candidatus Thermoplasmatota archaeon]
MFCNEYQPSIYFSQNFNEPPSGGNISGPLYGRPGVNYTFCITVIDPEADDVFCLWDWGDDTSSGWLGPYASGVEICATHAWSSEGVYEILVKLKDSYGAESEWSDPFTIVIDGTPPDVQILKPKRGFLYLWDKPHSMSQIFTIIVIGPITVVVSAVDSGSGMLQVEFYIDNELKGKDYTGENNTYSWRWDERVSLFPYTLTVIAYDLANNSASISIRIWKIF